MRNRLLSVMLVVILALVFWFFRIPEPQTRVVDLRGRPVSGAEVSIYAPDSKGSQFNLIATTRSRDGFVKFDLPRTYFLQVLKDGLAQDPQTMALGCKKIVMAPEGRITGTIRMANGRPFANCNIFAQGTNNAGFGGARTDKNGRYMLRCLWPFAATPDDTISGRMSSSAKYNVMLGGGRHKLLAQAVTVTVCQSKTASAPILIAKKGVLIRGKVLGPSGRFGRNRKPLSGVQVAVYGPMRPMTSAACMSTTTQSDGAYQIEVLPGRIHVYYQGGYLDYATGGPGTYQDVEVTQKGLGDVDFLLLR